MKRIRTKSDRDFVLKIMSVLKGFQYKGKKYLSYMETRSRGDEFLIRDNLVKPFFTDVLGYDKQKDFVPEEKIKTGKPDTQIVNASGNPVIVIETLSSSSDNRQFEEHRKRLFDYTDELGSKIAVLTNGIVFNAYWNRGRGKAKERLVFLNFDEIYKKFVLKGIDGLDSVDWERLLALKYLVKELQVINPEQLYKEPEFDISEERHFSNFLEQLISSMEQIKTDVKNQFELHQTENTEYRKLKEVREQSGHPIYASESKKYALSKKCIQSFQKWQDISSANRDPEAFQLETMYIFFNRILLLRICEDKGIIKKRKISNGGIKDWMTFKGFTHFSEVNYNELIKEAYKMMEKTYPHLFREDIFDWYMPNNEILLNVLFIFNPYNFKSVDRDILGKLYEKYIPREERKKLGQFYTPEEVINYILDAVGYREDADIEGKNLLDPACGSGGFLVRAANILIQRLKSRGFYAETILNKVQDNIYGFEINPFACHLTEINLLFQVIDLIKEAQKKNPEFEMYKFNIFETDSLRIPKKEKPELFKEYNSEWFEDAETVRKIKLKEGKFKHGFDFVVGNPPYGDILDSENKKNNQSRYPLVADYEISQYFLALGEELLKEKGYLGYIVTNTIMFNVNAENFRKQLLETCRVPQITDLSRVSVFLDPKVRNIILLLNKEFNTNLRNKSDVNAFICTDIKEGSLNIEFFNKTSLESLFKDDKEWLYIFRMKSDVIGIIKKIQLNTKRLDDITEISQGLIPYDKYRGHSPEIIKKRIWHANYKKDETYKRELRGGDIKRYSLSWNGRQWISYGKWLAAPREPKFFLSSRILIREITNEKTGEINATYSEYEYYNNPGIINVINKPDTAYNLKYLLSIINSKLFAFYHLHTSPKAKKGLFPKILVKDVRNIPIKPTSIETQQQFINLVDQILEINRTLPTLEERISNIQKLLEDFDIPFGDLADISGIRLELKERIGKPKIKSEGLMVHLDRKSYVECENDALAEYIELYLISLSEALRGKTKPELVKLIKIPKSLIQVKTVLGKRKELLKKIETIKQRQDGIDREIDQKVYKLYGLTKEEIKAIMN